MSTRKLVIAACEKGDLPQLQSVLEETELDVGSEPLGSEGETALHVTCAHGHLDIVQYLVNDRGCSVAVPNSRAVGATPLEVAWANKHWEVVEFLLNTIKEDIPLVQVGHQQAMFFSSLITSREAFNQSCVHGYSKIVKVLTEIPMCWMTKQSLHDGLLTTCHYGHLQLALYLTKERGCDPTLPSLDGVSPLELAWKNKHWKLTSCLVQAIQESGFHCAGRLSHTASTQFLEVASFGEDALHVACSRGFLEAVHFLRENLKCSLVQPSSQKKPPLTIARSNGHLLIIQFLLKNVTGTESDLTELHVACIVGDEEKVRVLSSNRTCLRATDSYGMTPVHYASCEPAALSILVSVIEHNEIQLLHMQDGKGNTPLHYAVITGCMEAVKIIFLNCECNPNIPNSEGCTPLHIAARRKEFEIAVLLLNHSQCNPNIQDQNGNTPLHIAINRMSLSSIKPFLNHDKIDPNIKNMQGNTPLHEAVMGETSVDVIEALIFHKSYNPSIMNEEGMTPLQVSVYFGKMHYVEVLVTSERYGHEDIVQAMESIPLLHQAVYSNRCKLVTRLLKVQECDVNKMNSAGETALHLACRTTCSKLMLEELVEDNRCDLNAQNQHGSTALHLAVLCTSETVEKVQCILQSERCNPNITNSDGYTPLHVAMIKKDFETAVILLNHSQCNPNIQDVTGNTPLHIAIIGKSFANIKSFLNHKNIDLNIQNINGNTPLHEAVKRQVPVDVVEGLTLHKSCNPNIANNAGMTPLQISADFEELNYAEVIITSGKCSHEDIVKATEDTLLLHKALLSNRPKLFFRLSKFLECNMNETDSAGNTVLHLACVTNHNKGVLKKLVQDSRCDLNVCNQHGDTALHFAVYSGTDVSEKVQCILQSERCNPNITNSEGYTPLHVAVKQRDFETAVILLNHSQCNPNIQDLTGNTPLHMALTSNISLPNIQPLLNHEDIDLSIQNGEGNIPLHEAVKRQVPVDVVEGLTLHKSCNPNIANNAGMTPLQISADFEEPNYAEVIITSGKCSHEDIVKATEGTPLLHKALLSNRPKVFFRLSKFLECNMNETDSAGNTVLHLACVTNHNKGVLKKLVQDSRCDLNVCNQHGDTALHLAVYSGTDVSEKVQCILQSERCNPNITNSEGYTPLHVAVKQRDFETAVILLNHSQCNPNIQDLTGNTPLHMALTSNISLPNVQPLLNHKDIDLSIQNGEGNIPLHEAVKRQVPVDVVEGLTLHKSCNPNIANNAGMTPLQISADFEELNYAEVIITSGKCSHEDIVKATEGTPLLHKALLSNRPKVFFRLSKFLECNMNETDSAGNTVLHLACVTNHNKGVLKKLVQDSRCDLNVCNQHGDTALHCAVYSGTAVSEKVQCILQSERCNPNITNSEGYTPLHVAVKQRDFETAVILLNHSQCNPNIQDLTGNTPLHMALTSNISLPNVQPLLNHKDIDLSIQNGEGNIPLHEAVKRQVPVDVVVALTLHKSCNPNIANNERMTPLQISVTSDKLHYTDMLITSGKCSHDDIVKATEGALLLYQAVFSNKPKLIVALLSIQELNMNGTNFAGETLLHVACKMRRSEAVVEKLVEDSRCDLNAQDQHGNTALHLVLHSASDSAEKVQCILQSERCNPNITNSEGYTPLYVAVKRKEFQSAAILLKHPKCNPNSQNIHGNTALHMAILKNTSLPNLQHFLNHKDIDLNIQNREGNTPLHVAVIRQVPVNVVTALVLHSSCTPSIANAEGTTPLQIAVDSQQMETAKAIITSRKCSCEDIERANKDAFFLFDAVSSDNVKLLTALINARVDISKSNSKGETALHAACKEGNIKAIELLLQGGADVLAVDCEGNAPIHVACANVNLECLSHILDHKRCNPNQQNAVGDTPLHIVCSYGWNCDIRMFRTLLSTPGINPECANHAGRIPAELAKSNYFVIGETSSFLKHRSTELETYLKIFVVGNSGGGKSTLIKAVTTERSKSFKNSFKPKNVNPSEVPPHTAGIVPLSFNSKHFGHAVLYDFAGQHEYYSSHAAVMENLVLPSPPLFLLLIDISKPMKEIKEELVYWWMFINNHSKRATAPPHVILVGSHKDTVKDRGGNVQKIMEEITDIVRDIPVSFQFDHSRAFPLDCRKLVSQGLTALLAQLKLTCQTLRQTADIDLHCHILKAFLTTNFHSSIACEVSEIAEKTNPEDDLLPQVPSQLIPLLSTLSDKGYILLLQNHTDVSKSWVVLQPEVLLTEVNGSIFAPDNFKEHCRGFAMSTGVVALSKIREKFGEPNNQVIIGYLTHLEFCFRIKDKHTLEMITKDTKMQLTPHSSEHAEEYYFFPALIWKENPSDVCQPQETIKYECGWFYRCNEPTEQLTTRFLHVLILRLAFSCDPPDESIDRKSVVLLRSCSVWKHGIAWWTNDGIETIVEVGLQCRWVAVMLRCPDTHKVQCAELRTKVISTVLKTKQDFCPAITMIEFLVAPSSLQYPFEGRELTLYSIKEIAKVVITGKEFPKDTEGKSTIHILQLLPFEPFFKFGENLIDSLFVHNQREIPQANIYQMAKICFKKLDEFMEALQPDPFTFQRECVKPDCTEVDRCVALFQIIQRRGCKTWRDFGQEFSKFSIFCGRYPKVSKILYNGTVVTNNHNQHLLSN